MPVQKMMLPLQPKKKNKRSMKSWRIVRKRQFLPLHLLQLR